MVEVSDAVSATNQVSAARAGHIREGSTDMCCTRLALRASPDSLGAMLLLSRAASTAVRDVYSAT
eukprot:20476-Heterococcus_DN1.PRE.1